MPIYKRCSRCGKRVPSGSNCECPKKRNNNCTKTHLNTKEKRFYSSAAWQTTRQQAIDQYNGIDIYSYLIFGIIEAGQTVHHIEPIRYKWEKRLDKSNLIYLTESNHQIIHHKMKQDYSGTIHILQNIAEEYRRLLGGT